MKNYQKILAVIALSSTCLAAPAPSDADVAPKKVKKQHATKAEKTEEKTVCEACEAIQQLKDQVAAQQDAIKAQQAEIDQLKHAQPPAAVPDETVAAAARQAEADAAAANAKAAAAQSQIAGLKTAIDTAADTAADIKMKLSAPDACKSGQEFAATDCALTWHGITVYGAYDIGVGWVSHGLPENGYNYEGESLVNRNGYEHRFLIAPNNLSQTGLGIKGEEEFHPGWSVVFNGSTGINPQSGLLANASETDIINNGLPRASYSMAIDGARAGQVFNDQFYGGISSTSFGTLTFGRQRSLGTDAMLIYDPASGAYAFSYIGYNGTMAGGGDTEDSRWDDAVKYRLTYGPAHFGAMYKFADGSGGCYSAAAAAGNSWTAANCTPESAHNNAYGFDLGGHAGKFSADVVYQVYNQAISVLNPLLGPQTTAGSGQSTQSTLNSIDTTPISGNNLIPTTNTLYGIVTDNRAIMFAAKYTWDKFKLFAGYEYIRQANPTDPLGVGASDQGGYILSGVEDNNLDLPKHVQILWTGGKYAIDSKTDITLSWYRQIQNDFHSGGCPTTDTLRSSCAGDLDEQSLYVDRHFTKRFDGFAGVAYSYVSGGLAVAIPHNGPNGSGVPYNSDSNWAPTVGGRFTF
jgi:predicted porin